MQVSITTEPDKKGFTHTGQHRLELTPLAYGSKQDDYCWSQMFVEPMMRIPFDDDKGYELIPASIDILKSLRGRLTAMATTRQETKITAWTNST